ncbi:hypothetical protein HN803_00790 [candidate division WWE3 bacterium]|jgi:hypothetical protein|nr:hypothetical protein [candidate division WWE3 bacterium]MBT7349318.1 hypothetical protein [candidate division WWE3 bacterium]
MNKTIQERQKKERKVLLDHLRKVPIIQLACERAGIGRATYYRWKKEDKEFAKEADKALRDGIALMNDFAESQLISAIKDKHMTAIIYWLKHRHNAYSTKIELKGELSHRSIPISKEHKELIQKALSLSLPEKANGKRS